RPEGSHAPFEDCLQLDAVGLVYPGGARVLCAVDLTIEAGAKIAIVGKTGAGKTSLVNLILGFVEPSEGRILYDGKAGRPLARLRCSATAYVQQEPFLLDTTVLENIAFAAKAESIDEAKVWEALRRARIDDMVRSLPEGLGTRLGENGIRFSGGERQRIALARAFYRQPLFLVLDEATSQLDTATEHDIIDDLLHHRPDMTVLMVTHRPAVARQFHRVLCVESRAVAEWAQSAELADAVPLGRNDAI
ncbi:MAG: ABC transporter ATP-binding protein, partial [Rhizomicrobium sp.]|nr:ABC transporter ATP-binding protein [Rhizomicrobium sp.]